MDRLPPEVIQRIILWTKEYARQKGKEASHAAQPHLAKLMRVSTTMQVHVAPILYRKVYIRDLNRFSAGLPPKPFSSPQPAGSRPATQVDASTVFTRYTKESLVDMVEEAILDIARGRCAAISILPYLLEHLVACLCRPDRATQQPVDNDTTSPRTAYATCRTLDDEDRWSTHPISRPTTQMSPLIAVNNLHDIHPIDEFGEQLVPGCSNRIFVAPRKLHGPSRYTGLSYCQQLERRYRSYRHLLKHTTLVFYFPKTMYGPYQIIIHTFDDSRGPINSGWKIAYQRTMGEADVARLCPPCTVCGRALVNKKSNTVIPADCSVDAEG